jgi:hypothetical protein
LVQVKVNGTGSGINTKILMEAVEGEEVHKVGDRMFQESGQTT